MIWAILALLGVPLWLCVAGLCILITRNRAIRKRPGSVKVRRRQPGKSRWTRGYGVWVHDVFAYRGVPAGWKESLVGVHEIVTLLPTEADGKKLRRLGSPPSIVRFINDDGQHIDFATDSAHSLDLLGGFAAEAVVQTPAPAADT